MVYLLCSLLSKWEFLLGIFSQPSAARYLLSICKRIIIMKKVIAGKICRAGNELPHTTSISWQPSLSRAESCARGPGLSPRLGQRLRGRKQSSTGNPASMASGSQPWSTGLDREAMLLHAWPPILQVLFFFKACWAQESH